MKKTLLILCALMAMSVCMAQHSLNPLNLLKAQKGLVAPHKMEMMKSPKVEKMAQHQANLKAHNLNKKSRKSAVPKKDEPVTVTIEEFYVENFCSGDYYNYLIVLLGTGSDGQSYYIPLDCYPAEKSWVGTFSVEDYTLGGSWCSAINYEEGSQWVSDELPSAVSITKTSPEHYVVEGTLYGDEGGVYVVKGEDLYYPDPKKYDMVGINWNGQYIGTTDEGVGQYLGQMITIDDAFFQLVFNLEEGQTAPVKNKTYTLDDMDSEYTAGYWNGTYIYIEELSFVYETANLQGDIRVNLHIKADTGDEYNITYVTPKAPETYNDIYLTADAAELYDLTADMGVWQFLGESQDGKYNLSVAGIGNQLIGEYDDEHVYGDFTYIGLSDLTVDIVYEYVKIDNVKVVAGPTEGDYICTADFYCYNGNCYHVTINHVRPAVTDNITIAATNLKSTYYEDEYAYVAHAINKDYEVAVVLPSTAETFKAEDIYVEIYELATDSEPAIYENYAFTAEYDEHGLISKLNGSCLSKDGKLYTLNLAHITPQPVSEKSFNISIANGELRPSDKGFTISGTDDNGEGGICLSFNSGKDFIGDYKRWNLVEAESYITEGTGWSASYFDVDDVDVNVSVSHEGTWDIATIAGTAIAVGQGEDFENVIKCNINMVVRIKNGFEMDEEDADFVAQYTTDQLSIMSNMDEGWILVQGKDAASQSFAVVFFADHLDSEITIPEGEYTFAQTQEPYTMYASDGLDETGMSATASFAAKTNILGFLEGNPWFIVSGKANVSNVNGNLTISLEGKNTYGRNILIGVNCDAPSAISNINVGKNRKSVRKLLQGNSIIIENNGHQFNADGQYVK